MPSMDFDLPSTDAEEEGVDPVDFNIRYKQRVKPARGTGKGKWVARSEHFDCLPYQPAYAVRWLAQSETGEKALSAVGYISRCLATTDDAVRFARLVDDRDVMLRGEELGAILEWLASTYSDRPTGTPSLSRGGPTPTGDGSTESSSTEEPT